MTLVRKGMMLFRSTSKWRLREDTPSLNDIVVGLMRNVDATICNLGRRIETGRKEGRSIDWRNEGIEKIVDQHRREWIRFKRAASVGRNDADGLQILITPRNEHEGRVGTVLLNGNECGLRRGESSRRLENQHKVEEEEEGKDGVGVGVGEKEFNP